ncbi:uncharacterized protein LOC129964082 isoform X2 [Argiope bruennichi]|uniref:uncharacterized protein LOC129964082 isoform X2 n=1 Tax=Argiope bruennichi TaxID=94029 RepID=UPI002495561F|nr:uncharacterized protein LOC129964082 isoform X2 [Argiope bruennichi]
MKVRLFVYLGIICVFLLFVTIINCSFVGESSQTIQALCSSNRYIYNLEPEVNHQLKLISSNSTGQINKWYHKSKRRCLKEFKTNNGASHFSIVISNMSIPSCSDKCHCNYFEIAELGHKEKFCGVKKDPFYFESKNGYLSIDFHSTQSMQFEVTLNIKVKRNTYIITGVPKEGYRSGQYIETPYFPELYQFDYIAEYVLQSDFSDGHVMLMFIDYQIARESFIEIVGHNGTHPARYNGDIFRPPVIISQNHQLNLRFEANNQVKPGFRAICFFIKDPDLKARKHYTNCGGSKYKLGGVLTIDIHANHDYYDCLWNLSPHIATFEQTSFFLFISNISLENIGPNTTLEFREGLNSKSKLVKSINCNNGSCDLIPTEITVPALTGLYIRFNGFLNPASVFKMVYGTYRTGNCSKDEVFCNERCLLTALRCDGIEQCPDGRDEEQCTSSSIVLSTTPRSVAPKLRLLSENAVASFWVMFSIGVCGIVIFILVMIFAIYRHLKAARSPSNTIEQPEVGRELSGPLPNVCSRISSCFDQPPSYEDFIQAADCYPPLLYTRAAKRNSEPYCRLHTTSFCGKDTLRHNSIHSFSNHSSDTSSTEESSLFPEPGCSFGQSNIKWTFENSHPRNQTSSSLKRATSFDSNLNNMSDSNNCHVHLFITHSMRPQAVVSKHNSLPTRFKINELKPHEIDITFQTVVPGLQCNKERRFSSCIVYHDSSVVRSEIMTTIKARCFSDPCKTQC